MRIGITHPLWIGSQPVQLTAKARRSTVEHVGVARVIHEPFYCKRGYAAATGNARRSVRQRIAENTPPSASRRMLKKFVQQGRSE
ncbi:MAG: hypothetical protein EWM73_02945 [Nitrospira sp.]|nr:MAG: hypothetical protein EWM73_02945 [Nitrospira sp.]